MAKAGQNRARAGDAEAAGGAPVPFRQPTTVRQAPTLVYQHRSLQDGVTRYPLGIGETTAILRIRGPRRELTRGKPFSRSIMCVCGTSKWEPLVGAGVSRDRLAGVWEEASPIIRAATTRTRRGLEHQGRMKMTTVNRRKFLKAASAATTGLAATSVAAPAIAQSMPEIKWRQTTSWPKSLDTLYGGAELIG